MKRRSLSQEKWNHAAEAILAGAELERMSDSMFELNIREGIKYMQSELQRRSNQEAPQRPSLLEGGY